MCFQSLRGNGLLKELFKLLRWKPPTLNILSVTIIASEGPPFPLYQIVLLQTALRSHSDFSSTQQWCVRICVGEKCQCHKPVIFYSFSSKWWWYFPIQPLFLGSNIYSWHHSVVSSQPPCSCLFGYPHPFVYFSSSCLFFYFFSTAYFCACLCVLDSLLLLFFFPLSFRSTAGDILWTSVLVLYLPLWAEPESRWNFPCLSALFNSRRLHRPIQLWALLPGPAVQCESQRCCGAYPQTHWYTPSF